MSHTISCRICAEMRQLVDKVSKLLPCVNKLSLVVSANNPFSLPENPKQCLTMSDFDNLDGILHTLGAHASTVSHYFGNPIQVTKLRRYVLEYIGNCAKMLFSSLSRETALYAFWFGSQTRSTVNDHKLMVAISDKRKKLHI